MTTGIRKVAPERVEAFNFGRSCVIIMPWRRPFRLGRIAPALAQYLEV